MRDAAFSIWRIIMRHFLVAIVASGLLIAGLPVWAQSIAPKAGGNPMRLAADHATASVEDCDKESEWYQLVFGMQLVSRNKMSDAFEVLQLGIPGFRIDLVKQKASSRQHQTTGYFTQGWLHVVFRTPAIDAAYKHLQELGTDVTANRDAQGVIYRLVVHDPEGNELEVVPLTSPQVAAPR
jgi:catechol 2,3-dioxygenase-like lactoylglutathione lyase family enzyme